MWLRRWLTSFNTWSYLVNFVADLVRLVSYALFLGESTAIGNLKILVPRGSYRLEKRGMRVCFLGEGASVHLQRLANSFAKMGHDVHVVTGRIDRTQSTFIESVHVHELVTVVRQRGRSPRPRTSIGWLVSIFLWAVQVRCLLYRLRPDVLNGHFVTVWGYLAAWSHYRPFVMTPWGTDIFRDPARTPLFQNLAVQVLRTADIVVCDSQTMEEATLGFGINPSKTRRIGLGVVTGLFSPSSRTKQLANRLGDPASLLVVSIRNLRPIYNVEMLIRAIPLVVGRVSKALFVIGGDGEQSSYLHGLAEDLGVAASVRWLGWVPHDQVPELLASCDVYVSTSLSDSTSLSLQEAMACQLAPTATDIPANREWITDGQNGFIVSPGDVVALAGRIIQLLESNELRNEFGVRSRQIIQRHAEERREMMKLERTFQSLRDMTRESQ